MDEATLEAAIAAYGVQLQQVEMALSASLDPSQQPDLLKLKEDLCQLIELTEASLMSVKKSQLLASLEDSNEPNGNTCEVAADTTRVDGNLNTEFAAFYSELGECSGSGSDSREKDEEGREGDGEEEEDEEGEDALSGTKVRAPYRTSWGTLEYHNAMVVGAEPPDGEEAQVRVFFVYPTQKSMKPCPFYLEDKCRFQENCRFSHGEVVYVSELREFLDCDLSNLEEGSACLARHEDGIWYPARIKEIDGGFFTVKFDSLLMKDVVVEADGVIPPLREDDPLSSDPDSDDAADADAVGYAKVLDSATESSEAVSSVNFGGWEAHTRGIGSKLMLKMGYEFGKAAQDGAQTSRTKRSRKPKVSAGGRRTIFDFLNHKLGDKSSDPAAAGAAGATGVEAYRAGKSTKRSLNVKLFQAAERVAQTEREIQKLSESLGRQMGRDSFRVKQLEEKLSVARHLLAQQKAHELSIQREHKKADTHKKMTEF
ncbi:hypothetical protein CCH79_00017970 [Gambusia affinis]|uniref:C3H1-type domain-containing protein n=1 Tax=Gambusia affinis TaxID=33528 RepID=A0A315W8H9_GAMAF|nr:hypothetical protein CCH79_00017970 [Gambusia affinis]